ncbi:MAG: hypothetical protein RR386_09070, partial [Bacteroidaceae bacterium]
KDETQETDGHTTGLLHLRFAKTEHHKRMNTNEMPHYLPFCASKRKNAIVLQGVLSTKGLTQEQISDVFDSISGPHYPKARISCMVEGVRTPMRN